MTMNIDTQSKITSVNTNSTTSSKTQKESDVKFSDELSCKCVYVGEDGIRHFKLIFKH